MRKFAGVLFMVMTLGACVSPHALPPVSGELQPVNTPDVMVNQGK